MIQNIVPDDQKLKNEKLEIEQLKVAQSSKLAFEKFPSFSSFGIIKWKFLFIVKKSNTLRTEFYDLRHLIFKKFIIDLVCIL